MEVATLKDIPPRPGRIAKCIMIIGKPGTGKSTLELNMAKQYAAKGGRALLVLASPDDWSQISLKCDINDKRSCDYIGIKHHIYCEDEDFNMIYKNFHNSFVAFDDTRAYLPADFSHSKIRQFLLRRRQQMIDVVFSAHSFAEIPPKMFDFITDYVILPTNSHPKCRERYISNPDLYENLCATVERVNKIGKTNMHYCETVKNR